MVGRVVFVSPATESVPYYGNISENQSTSLEDETGKIEVKLWGSNIWALDSGKTYKLTHLQHESLEATCISPQPTALRCNKWNHRQPWWHWHRPPLKNTESTPCRVQWRGSRSPCHIDVGTAKPGRKPSMKIQKPSLWKEQTLVESGDIRAYCCGDFLYSFRNRRTDIKLVKLRAQALPPEGKSVTLVKGLGRCWRTFFRFRFVSFSNSEWSCGFHQQDRWDQQHFRCCTRRRPRVVNLIECKL